VLTFIVFKAAKQDTVVSLLHEHLFIDHLREGKHMDDDDDDNDDDNGDSDDDNDNDDEDNDDDGVDDDDDQS
jgi:hypothetical protein